MLWVNEEEGTLQVTRKRIGGKWAGARFLGAGQMVGINLRADSSVGDDRRAELVATLKL